VNGELLELLGPSVAQSAVRAHGIVVLTPGFDCFARLAEAHEPVLVETLVAHAPVEALDVGVLVGLARLDEMQLDPVRMSPRVERPADELTAVAGAHAPP